jgi:hypothetical protein
MGHFSILGPYGWIFIRFCIYCFLIFYIFNSYSPEFSKVFILHIFNYLKTKLPYGYDTYFLIIAWCNDCCFNLSNLYLGYKHNT